MLNTLTQYGGVAVPQRPLFAKQPLNTLFAAEQEGYTWAKGVHLYSELRPVEGFEATENDQTAQAYLQAIEDYAHAGLVAAGLFDLKLLELQGNVLHFHKEGDLTKESATEALQFSYVLMKVLYETLAADLGRRWNGFAICMDHGDSIIVRHGNTSSASSVSLGPSANRPAKRLLYGRTAAGHAELPGEWIRTLWRVPCGQDWYAFNLRDRNQLPVLGVMENAQLERQLREVIAAYRTEKSQTRAGRKFSLLEANAMIDQGNFSTDQPLRMRAYCMRADLDGFSAKIAAAFKQGDQAVEAIARGFKKIMEFGDYFEKAHYGVVRLPWAGDCVSFLIPPAGELHAFRGKDWVPFVEEWQTFAANTDEGRKHRWGTTFSDVSWAIGMTYARTGSCLVAPVEALTRRFLIGAGSPLATANDAQNRGKGGETIIHNTDYDEAYPIVQKLFKNVSGCEFWSGEEVTLKKIQVAAIEAGRSENASKLQFCDKAKTVTIPPPRPYFKG